MPEQHPRMQYRPGAGGDMLSVLGFGCMRFTKKNGAVDLDKAEAELRAAIDGGVNYLDTAYIYAGNEAALGRILERSGLRERVYLATKLPQYLMKSISAVEKTFREELTRLRTDRIDYYLMHMITDEAQWRRLEAMGIREWIAEKKASGAIRHIGFSFHGNTEMFLRVLAAYDWDFCQIQYNYMDEYTQAGIDGLNYAHEKGIPVIIMEPLRGGRLVNQLPEAAKKEFAAADRDYSPAEWGLRWIWNHEQVNVILSGMNDVAQVEENCRIASDAQAHALTEEELLVFERVKAAINSSVKVGCTGCGYCMPCPQGVDIPTCFQAYNRSYTDSWFGGMIAYFMCTTLRQDKTIASKCVGCGKCEQHCPQQIHIREELKNVKKRMENPIYHIAGFVTDRLYKY